MRPLRMIAGALYFVEHPLQARPGGPAFARAAAGSHAGAGAVNGVGEVEQVRSFGVVELQRAGDGVQNGGGYAGNRAAFELGVVLDTDPGEGGDLAAAQPGHPASSDRRHPRLLRGDLGSPRDQELADLGTVVHTVDATGFLGAWDALSVHEKTNLFRTEKRRDADGRSYPWIVKSTGVVNHFYFYCLDADFGPFFVKFCSYFPYNAKLCLNGHHWAQRQAGKAEITFTAMDNAFAAVDDVEALQAICDLLGPAQIYALLDKWLTLLLDPFTDADRAAGYRYYISICRRSSP